MINTFRQATLTTKGGLLVITSICFPILIFILSNESGYQLEMELREVLSPNTRFLGISFKYYLALSVLALASGITMIVLGRTSQVGGPTSKEVNKPSFESLQAKSKSVTSNSLLNVSTKVPRDRSQGWSVGKWIAIYIFVILLPGGSLLGLGVSIYGLIFHRNKDPAGSLLALSIILPILSMILRAMTRS